MMLPKTLIIFRHVCSRSKNSDNKCEEAQHIRIFPIWSARYFADWSFAIEPIKSGNACKDIHARNYHKLLEQKKTSLKNSQKSFSHGNYSKHKLYLQNLYLQKSTIYLKKVWFYDDSVKTSESFNISYSCNLRECDVHIPDPEVLFIKI